MNSIQKGFSLVELMIVVAIIGILASVAIPRLLQYICTSRAKSVMTNVAEAKSHIGDEYTKFTNTVQSHQLH